MAIDKNIIKKSFSEAAQSYDSHSGLQRSVARELIEFLGSVAGLRKPAYAFSTPGGIQEVIPADKVRILDIGCGTGGLTGGIKGLFPGAALCASDIAFPMLAKARENLCGEVTRLVQADCETLPFGGSAFDIVASSLTYQWAADVFSAFKEAKRVLKKNGLLAFSTLGPDTLKELRECLNLSDPTFKHPIKFRSTDEIALELRKAGFDVEAVESRDVTMTYESMRGLIRTLKYIGASPPLNDGDKGRSIGLTLRAAERIYGEIYPSADGRGVTATYEVIFAAARKVQE